MNPDSVTTFFYVYVLRSTKDSKWYIGFTHDLRKRFKEHNNGTSTYTKGRGPFELIYYEAYRNGEDARSREKQIKSGQGRAYLKQRMKRFLTLSG
jgi:putative endonuclease